jgi:hypothetical protein
MKERELRVLALQAELWKQPVWFTIAGYERLCSARRRTKIIRSQKSELGLASGCAAHDPIR